MSANYRNLLLLLLSLFVAACGDDSLEPPPEPEPDPQAPVLPFKEFASTDATLQATYYSTIVDSGLIGRITFFQGLATAVFSTPNGLTTVPERVVAEGQQLSYRNGRFRNDPGQTHGIDYGSSSEWTVEGNVAVPDFEDEIEDFVPEIGNVTLGDSLDTSEELELAIDTESPYTNVGTLDSINYRIVGKQTTLIIKTDHNDPVTFSPEELSGLGGGNAWIQVEGFRYQEREYSDYSVTYVHKGVFNKKVWVH